MKKNRWIKVGLAICFMLGMLLLPAGKLNVRAAEIIATVQGTVTSQTTTEILYLSTSGGTMQIKIDSATDTSGCKVLLPGKQITVSVSRGNDGYLHAVKLTAEAQTAAVTVDTSATAVVSGSIDKRTSDDMIYLNTSQGQMQIKLDASTDMSNCTVLVAGATYQITCARGSDAYMHAVSIADGAKKTASGTGTVSSSTGLTPAPADPANVSTATMAVAGTVTDKTTETLLYLSTTGGEMQFVIDSNTDSRNGMVLTPGTQLIVAFYRGSDAYMHAVAIVGVKGVSTATVDTSAMAAVSGTVGSKSNENVLYLETQGGTMELKLDHVRSVSNCKVLVTGKKISVNCARGNDAYMHAIDITG